MTTYVAITTTGTPTSALTATFATSIMTVTAITGTLVVGAFIYGASVPANTYITSFGTGGGGLGTYNLSTTPGTLGSTSCTTLYGYLVASDWNSSDNLVECIGGGGSGTGNSNRSGGGGAYAATPNVTLTPGNYVPYHVSPTSPGVVVAGLQAGATWFNGASSGAATVMAEAGNGGSGATASQGGKAANSTGTTKFDGGNGSNLAGGAGGAAGPFGAGGSGPGNSGGGGGNGGGSNGASNPGGGFYGDGGNNHSGTGHGTGGNVGNSTPATAGTNGGGGGGGEPGAGGGNGTDLADGAHGSGGGGGTTGNNQNAVAHGGLYGGGGGPAQVGWTGGDGAQGIIFLSYSADITLALTGSVMTFATGNVGGAGDRSIALVGTGMTFSAGTLFASYGPSAGIGFPPPFPPVPEILTDPQDISFSAKLHRRKIASAVNLHNQGKFNCVIDVVVTPSATTTAITDARISPFSSLEIMAMDANGAADIVAGIWFDTFLKGSCVMNHRSDSSTRTLRLTILG